MGKYEKLALKILLGRSDNNISFKQLCQLLRSLGFEERIKGSHHIFNQESVEEILNIQASGAKAKRYQVKQIREVIIKYELKIDSNDEL